jgi:3-oxoacyl-[acyl-carrier protein] reductase
LDLGLHGRVALVTGATHGIGRDIARAFAAEGAHVALTYRSSADRAADLAGELGADRAQALPYDLADLDGHQDTVRAVVGRWGRLDILVANAVLRPPRRGPQDSFEDVPTTRWAPVITGNLAGVIRTVQCAVAEMRHRKWGRIVLVSSHNALGGGRGQEFYGAAKAGLHGLAASLAWDVGPDGILVNVVCPGLTATDAVLTMLPPQVRENETAQTPTGSLSVPHEVASAVVYLCSAANGNITGETVSVSGGR